MSNRKLDCEIAEKCFGYTRMIAPKDGKGEHGGNEILIPHDFKKLTSDGWDFPEQGPIDFGYMVPQYSKSLADAWPFVDWMNSRGVEVTMASFEPNANRNRYAVELRRWRDRRAEGIPGDPHTGRSRETFKVLSGNDLPEMICECFLFAYWHLKAWRDRV